MRAFIALITLACIGSAQADTLLGIYAGAGTWKQDYSGDAAAFGTAIDLEDDLGFTDETNNILYAALEHGVPVLPNIRVQHSNISIDADNMLSRTIDFNGVTFPLNETIATELDLTQTDLVLYYEILDNVFSLDVGLAVRWVDGHFDIASSVDSTRAEFKGVLPMLYGKARVDLPFSGFWLGAEAQGLGYDGSQLFDANVQLGWESPIGLGLEAGWRTYRLELDDVDDFSDASIDVSGPYAALNYHF